MKLIKTIFKVIYLILMQILISPIRVISYTLGVIETVFRVLKRTVNCLISEIENEVLR